jgi:hypothetical protein
VEATEEKRCGQTWTKCKGGISRVWGVLRGRG